ncbi:MAG: carbohydrate kinase family protein, partial [Bacillota bacterium]
ESTAERGNLKDWSNILKNIDIVFINKDGIKNLTKHKKINSGAEVLMDKGPNMVVITLGSKGVKIFRKNNKNINIPGYKVKAKDTTGAGDCFNGVFLSNIAKGWNIEKSAKYANAAAAISVKSIGSRSGIPTEIETKNFLDKRKDN